MSKKTRQTKQRAAPAIVGQKRDVSHALRVGKRQIAQANEAAQEMGCGTPFRADGLFQGSRVEKKRYMKEINRRRADEGSPRLVNFDGGYGDET